MTLTPKLISQTGDWFLQTRLPEFAVGWKDPQGKIHHLEIVGRKLSCREHNDPLLSGIIHLPQPNGSYQLPCLELQTHWPALFTAGAEFLHLSHYASFLSNNQPVGKLNIAGDNSVNQAHDHILATMISHLATTAIALRDQQRRRTYGYDPRLDYLPVARGSDFLNATDNLQVLAHLGTAGLVPPADLENFLALLAPFSDPNLKAKRAHQPQMNNAHLENLITKWRVPSDWPARVAAPTPDIDSTPSLVIE